MLTRPTTASLTRTQSMKRSTSTTSSKPSTANVMYPRRSAIEQIIQRQRPLRLASLWGSSQSKHARELKSKEKSDSPMIYHPWKEEYSQIVTREKKLKSMTKDSYTSLSGLISYAVEHVTTELECYSTLIPANTVTIKNIKVYKSSQPAPPRIVRYLRRCDLMPSEKLTPKPNISSLELNNNTPIISIKSPITTTDTPPNLVIKDRLLNRATIRTDPCVIRRPPRKLKINLSHETITQLSIYG